jgi:hypothetical protein
MREGPDFVFWFIKWGTAVVLVVLAISAVLFWLLKRWSDRQAAEHERRAGAKRRP